MRNKLLFNTSLKFRKKIIESIIVDYGNQKIKKELCIYFEPYLTNNGIRPSITTFENFNIDLGYYMFLNLKFYYQIDLSKFNIVMLFKNPSILDIMKIFELNEID